MTLEQSEPANSTENLIERLRGPVFGTQTALDAATAIETWKARAERLADMHRDMCVVAGEAVARAETAEAALASRPSVAPPGDGVPGMVLVAEQAEHVALGMDCRQDVTRATQVLIEMIRALSTASSSGRETP